MTQSYVQKAHLIPDLDETYARLDNLQITLVGLTYLRRKEREQVDRLLKQVRDCMSTIAEILEPFSEW